LEILITIVLLALLALFIFFFPTIINFVKLVFGFFARTSSHRGNQATTSEVAPRSYEYYKKAVEDVSYKSFYK